MKSTENPTRMRPTAAATEAGSTDDASSAMKIFSWYQDSLGFLLQYVLNLSGHFFQYE